MKSVTVTMGPQVRKLASYKLARMTLDACGDNLEQAERFVEDIEAIHEALGWTIRQIARLKTATDCPFQNDEDIAADVIQKIEQAEKERILAN